MVWGGTRSPKQESGGVTITGQRVALSGIVKNLALATNINSDRRSKLLQEQRDKNIHKDLKLALRSLLKLRKLTAVLA